MNKRRAYTLSLIALSALLLLALPLINGFPFTYPDTGTYLRSAFRGFVPFDRPYWYGVFIRLASGGGLSLWGVVVVQALLTAWLSAALLRALGVKHVAQVLVSMAVLTATTGVAWYAGQLMPDIFTALGVMGLLLFLLDEGSLQRRAPYLGVVVLAVLVHSSNLLAFTVLLLVLMAGVGRIPWSRRRMAALLFAATWPVLVLLNLMVTRTPQLGRGAEVFLTARLIDAGILQEWLDATCPDDQALCDFRGALPGTGNEFLWAPSSPLYVLGGWEHAPARLRPTVFGALKEPGLLLRFASSSVAGAARQLVHWNVGAGFIGRDLQEPTNPVHDMVRNTMQQDHPAFLRARQSTGDGNEGWLRAMDRVFAPVMALSHLLLILFLLVPRWTTPRWRQAATVVAVALVANALVCATLSMVADRFGSRLNWLVPLLVLAALWHLWAQRAGGKTSSARSSQPQPGL